MKKTVAIIYKTTKAEAQQLIKVFYQLIFLVMFLAVNHMQAYENQVFAAIDARLDT